MAIDKSPVPAPVASASATDRELATFEERWATWRAQGITHDRAVRRKLAIAAPIAVIVAALVISAILAR